MPLEHFYDGYPLDPKAVKYVTPKGPLKILGVDAMTLNDGDQILVKDQPKRSWMDRLLRRNRHVPEGIYIVRKHFG